MNRNAKIVSRKYRAFVKRKGCLICGEAGPDFHHLKARGFGSGKQNDYTGIPLSRKYHQQLEAIGLSSFQDTYKINLYEQALWLFLEYAVEKGWIETSGKEVNERIAHTT
jgi:hypothetical protein